MNEQLPYENELAKKWDELSIPDENISWNDMKRRLEEDKDDGIIIPPIQKGCIGYGLLLLSLAVISFIMIRPDGWLWNKNEKNIASTKETRNGRDTAVLIYTGKDSLSGSKLNSHIIHPGKNTGSLVDKDTLHDITNDSFQSSNIEVRNFSKTNNKKNPYLPKKVVIKTHQEKSESEIQKNKNLIPVEKTKGNLKSTISQNEQDSDSVLKNDPVTGSKSGMDNNDSTFAIKIPADSIIKKSLDSNKTKNTDSTNKYVREDSSVKREIYFAAGIAVHQQIPIAGQSLTPYNSLGRKGSLADYIPSLYLRMYRDKKWFIQGEFRYGAPQSTKEILYKQNKIIDTFANTTLTTSNRVKKTYYHQLPVSFNYYPIRNFSIGLGIAWNKFSSAVIEQESNLTNNITMIDSSQVTTVSNLKKPDSNFSKSYFQALVETQYEWKRFSFGARYSFGLQPYIKFQLPGGVQQEEKNNVLQIFIRYNLWESKKK